MKKSNQRRRRTRHNRAPGDLRYRGCTKKRRFSTEYEAQKAAAFANRAPMDRFGNPKFCTLRIYECQNCHGWHLSSTLAPDTIVREWSEG